MKISTKAISLQWMASIAMAIGAEGFAPAVQHTALSPLKMAGDEKSDIEPVYAAKTISSFDRYKKIHAESIRDPAKYWGKLARTELDWMKPFDDDRVLEGDLTNGDVRWFAGGKLNAAYNALDRHNPDDLAIIWEGDEPDDIRRITFGEAQNKVSQIANALKAKGVKKGDVVTIYMPMIPELAMTMLACARIGAVHSVVFAGFSAEALASRVKAASCQTVVTGDFGMRGGRKIDLKAIVDNAMDLIDDKDLVKNVLVWERGFKEGVTTAEDDTTYEMKEKDVRMDLLVANQRPFCAPEPMDAEDNLFILYTSGSTGMPKVRIACDHLYVFPAYLNSLWIVCLPFYFFKKILCLTGSSSHNRWIFLVCGSNCQKYL